MTVLIFIVCMLKLFRKQDDFTPLEWKH